MTATPVTIPAANGQWSAPAHVVVVPFTEAGAAGTYTETVKLPAGSQILDVIWTTQVLWGAGTSATLDVGDSVGSKGYMNDVDLKTAPTVAHGASNASAGTIGTFTGTKYYPNGDTITATVVTVGTTSSVGRGYLAIVYAVAPTLGTPTQA